MRMYGKEYEKAKEALEGKRDDVYPCREDVPADLWGKPIPKDKMPFKCLTFLQFCQESFLFAC